VSGNVITISGLTLKGGSLITLTYGNGAGITAPATLGTSVWIFAEASTAIGALTALTSQPTVLVSAAPDGSGTAVSSLSSAVAGSTLTPITFTYTAATGGIVNGSITLAIPAGWATPSLVSTAPGYIRSSSGTITVSGSTVTISGLTLSAKGTVSITYGSTSTLTASKLIAPKQGQYTFAFSEKSTSTGVLTAIGTSPSIKTTLK
jgi:hypothetical protein